MQDLLKTFNTNTANSTPATIGNNTPQPLAQSTPTMTPQTSTVDIPKTIPSDTLAYKAPTGSAIETPINAPSQNLDALSGAIMTAQIAPVVQPSERDLAIKDRQTAIDQYLNPESGYSATSLKLQNETGLQDKTNALNALGVKDIALQKQLQDYQDNIINKNPNGLFGGAGQQAISQYQRDISSQRANLAIQKLALQGDIKGATDLINLKLDAQFKPISDRIDYLDKTLSIYSNDLSESDKQKLELEKYQLQTQIKDKSDFQSIIDEAGVKGAPVDVQNNATKLFAQGDRAGAIALLAPFSVKAQVDSLTPYQKFQATQSIAKDVQARTANAREMARQAKLITDSYNNVLKGGDRSLNTQAIITSFNKILDPTSVVRESEYDRTAQGQDLIEQLRGKYDTIVAGGAGVTEATLKEASDIAQTYLKSSQESINAENERAKSMARQFGLTEENVTSQGYENTKTSLPADNELMKKYNLTPEELQQYKKSRGLSKVGSDTNQASNGIVAGYDIKSYATDPKHEVNVANIYSKIPDVSTTDTIDSYIKKVAKNSPVTGQAIIAAAQKYNVDPKMILAIMQQDSTLGTAGKAVRTKNPGNVGNDDTGALRTYSSWDDGVMAVAKNLAWRKINKTA